MRGGDYCRFLILTFSGRSVLPAQTGEAYIRKIRHNDKGRDLLFFREINLAVFFLLLFFVPFFICKVYVCNVYLIVGQIPTGN